MKQHRPSTLGRRAALALGMAAALVRPPGVAASPMTRRLPRGGESLPVIGLGSWITFNVGDDPEARDSCAEVMRAFFAGGGRMIDSSPMYGSSQEVIGYGLEKLGHPPSLYAATKVWTSRGSAGPAQIEASRRLWDIPRFDLLQVHNLVAWEPHLRTLHAMQAEGRVRHVGVTTSHGRRHDEIERIMRHEPLDFVQVTYNPVDREVEARILPLALERGIGVIVNRPFQQGALTEALAGRPLPGWAEEVEAASWAQLLLKWIVAHPAVTCAIPATTRADHVRENLAAGVGPLPDAALRARLVAELEDL